MLAGKVIPSSIETLRLATIDTLAVSDVNFFKRDMISDMYSKNLALCFSDNSAKAKLFSRDNNNHSNPRVDRTYFYNKDININKF